jgi:PAS domain S-box-containing protein
MSFPSEDAFSPPILNTILNSVQQAIIVMDTNGRVTYWNHAAESIYGWTTEEALGSNIVELTLPTSLADQARFSLEKLVQVNTWSGETLAQHKDGTIFTVSASTSLMFDGANNPVGIVGISSIFDERRQIEETITKLASTLHASNEGLLGYTLQGEVVSLNTAAARLLGVQPREAVNDPVAALLTLPPTQLLEMQYALTHGQQVPDFETEITNASDERFELRISLSPIRDRAERVIGFCAVIRDMTEMRRAERQQQEAEALHQLILSNISDAVFITDEAGQFTYVCPNVHVIWAYDQQEVQALGNISYLLGSTLCDTASLDAAGELHNRECEALNGNDGPRWLLVNIKRVNIAGGTRLYTCRDASDRKQMMEQLRQQTALLADELTERQTIEMALRNSESLLRRVLEALPVGVWVTDAEGNITSTNPAAEAIWGAIRGRGVPNDAEYIGWYTDSGERIRDEDWGIARAVFHGETTQNRLIDIQTFDAKQRTIIDSAAPIYDERGQLLGAIAVDQDVTEQRRAQLAEREERQFAAALSGVVSALSRTLNLNGVLETILEYIGQVVPHDAANLTLIEGELARPACWRGYSEAAQVYFQNLRYPLTTPWIKRMLETGEPDLVNDVTSKPSWPATPSLAWIGSVLSVPIRAHDTIIGFLNLDSAQPGFFTPQHRERLIVFASQAAIAIENAQLYTQTRQHASELEERVRQRTLELEIALAKEKELSELKSRFVSMVSHEFRTPLASIQTSSDLLRHYYDRMTTEQRQNALVKIQAEIKRLTSILENVLAFGRAEAVGIEIHPESVDLIGLCESVVAEVKAAAGYQHHIVLHSNRPSGKVELDTKVFRHALVNLLENAVKYSPPKTTIRLRVALLDRAAMITVSDEGIGIPQEDIPQLFEAFHRGRNVGSANGTGLGLVIVKQAIDAHHGSINVDSQLNQGTTFTLTIPVRQTGERNVTGRSNV